MAKKPTKTKSQKTPAKKQIATLTHDGAKRTNIPIAEYQPVVPKEQ